jgi:hypothetical protein
MASTIADPSNRATDSVLATPGPPVSDVAWLRRPAVIIAFLAVLLTANLLTVAYVSREQTIYYWDYGAYWSASRDLADFIARSPRQALRGILHSVANDDYNCLPAVPVSLVMLVLGKSRLDYELAIINTHLAAVLLTFLLLVRRLSAPGACDQRVLLVALITFLSWGIAWVAVLRGLPDLGGVALINLILLTYFRQPVTQLRWRALVGLGLLVAFVVLFRRWYAFWALHFLVLMGVEGTVGLVRQRSVAPRCLFRALRPCLTTGLVALITLLTLGRHWMIRAATTNYADIYSAYRPYAGWQIVKETASYLGNLHIAAFAVGAVVLAYAAPTRRLMLCLALHLSLTYMHFTRIQFFGCQHLYLILPTVVLVVALLWVKIMNCPRPLLGSLAFAVFALACLGTLTFTFRATPPGDLRFLTPLASTCTAAPMVRNDLAEFNRMAYVLDDLTGKSNDQIYVLSSSNDFNPDHLVKVGLSLPMTCDLRQRLAFVPQIDKRDGFPNALLTAKIVVVAEPLQLCKGMGRECQRVVWFPTESFLHGKDLGQAFERLPYEFHLDKGVRVWIYRKKRAIEPGELLAFRDRLREAYPDRPFVWQPAGQ